MAYNKIKSIERTNLRLSKYKANYILQHTFMQLYTVTTMPMCTMTHAQRLVFVVLNVPRGVG